MGATTTAQDVVARGQVMRAVRVKQQSEFGGRWRVRLGPCVLLGTTVLGAGCADLLGFEEGQPFPPDGGQDAATTPEASANDGPIESAPQIDAGPCSTLDPTPTKCLANTPQFCNASGYWESVPSGPCPGVSTCSNGSCVCNFSMCPTGCSDLNSDGRNCGGCGHDCQGGLCQAAKCQPVILASGRNHPTALAIDASNVYWVDTGDLAGNNGAVMQVAANGASLPVPLAPSQPFPQGIAADGTSVY